MVDYIFTDNAGAVFVKARTDAPDATTQAFTIMEVNDAPGGYYLLSNALQTAFGLNLNLANTTQAALIALAVSLGYNLVAYQVGSPVSVPGVVLASLLASPTNFAAATGSGASGTMALSWSAVSGATNYVIDRSNNQQFINGGIRGDIVNLGIYSGSGTSFTDTLLTPTTVYYYRIRAQEAAFVDSAYSLAQGLSHT